MDTGWISDRRSRGAWVGAAAYFLLTGVIFATWASRVPAIKGGLNFGEGQFATALLGLEAGAVLGLQLGGLLVPRVGSRRALTASLVAFACALSGLAFAPGLPLLAASARHRRGRQRSRRAPATAAARVSTLGYLGSFVGPALVGGLASLSSLPVALGLPALLVLATAFGARAVRLAG